MADRSIIQWDKDDIDAVGLLKIDILGVRVTMGQQRYSVRKRYQSPPKRQWQRAHERTVRACAARRNEALLASIESSK